MLNKINANQLIVVNQLKSTDKALLKFYERKDESFDLILKTDAFIGKNGMTVDKKEGDGKTPKGIYELGLAFGMHDKKQISIDNSIKYMKINENLYWVDDVNSIYYNQLVDSRKVIKDWKSAEHLIEYPKQYEYAIEIRTNIENVPGKGSAIFLHCSNDKPTAGCVAIDRENMIELFKMLKRGAVIIIQN